MIFIKLLLVGHVSKCYIWLVLGGFLGRFWLKGGSPFAMIMIFLKNKNKDDTWQPTPHDWNNFNYLYF